MDPQTQDQPQLAESQSAPTSDVRQQIVQTIQGSKNVLVTVGSNPSVDELASALGLTLLLGKLDKHVTAVFSGEIPAAMEFLEPEGTFENTVDSLRDFIIALDKQKADKLRYKVEDDVVKIFITPYKTIISQKDLNFSQGDFNVDVVIALGAQNREELDKAITAHGRILHDAVVITINAGQQKSNLSSLDWTDQSASSVAEILVNLSSDFGDEILDSQISTAFLTGIVAETNRFSNEKTSPKVMMMSAQLMAAGANQQLIATNLRQEGMISEQVRTKDTTKQSDDNGEMVLDHKEQTYPNQNPKQQNQKKKSDSNKNRSNKSDNKEFNSDAVLDGSNSPSDQLKNALDKASELQNQNKKQDTDQKLSHDLLNNEQLAQNSEKTLGDSSASDTTTDQSITEDAQVAEAPQEHREKVIESIPSVPSQAFDTIPEIITEQPIKPVITPFSEHAPMDKPTFGGTLNATTANAEEDRELQAERELEVNNVALDHDSSIHSNDSLEEARRAVQDAAVSQPFNPTNQPLEAITAQPLQSENSGPSFNFNTVPEPSSEASTLPNAPTLQSAPAGPSPVEAFMQPQTIPNAPNSAFTNGPTSPALVIPANNDPSGLPPLPPMPIISGVAMPPMPPMPGQLLDQATSYQPQINPEFMQNMPQSQNYWTDAAQDLTAKREDIEANRHARTDKLTQQYDTAVDRNRELQGLPPVNDPNGSGFPPVPPMQ